MQKPAPLTIRPMEQGDIPSVLTLIAELAEHEGESAPSIIAEILQRDVVETTATQLDVAVREEAILGFVHYYPGYDLATGTRGMHLGDICVTRTKRRQKIGHRLLKHLAEKTLTAGGSWMTWRLLADNTEAHSFYLSHRALISDGVNAMSLGISTLKILAHEQHDD